VGEGRRVARRRVGREAEPRVGEHPGCFLFFGDVFLDMRRKDGWVVSRAAGGGGPSWGRGGGRASLIGVGWGWVV
jgi:hypothetical protein